MALNHSSKPEDQAQTILTLATDIRNQLTRGDGSRQPLLDRKTHGLLQKTLHRLPLTDSFSTSTRRQLDNEGAKLWNTTRLLNENAVESNTDNVLLCQVRALAYFILEAATPRTDSGDYRCLGISFRLVKSGIDHGLLDLSQKVMELAAARLDSLDKPRVDANTTRLAAISTEYYTLRIYLAWSQDRLDIADHMFSKIEEARTMEQQMVIVDICYTIGDKTLQTHQYETANLWLHRASTVCELWADDGMHGAKQNLKSKRLLVLHAYARTNLHLKTVDSAGQLRRVLDLLRTEYGDSFPVLLFSLEILNKNALNEDYFKTLKSSIQRLDDNEASLKIIYHHITKIGSLNLELFVETCGQLLNKLAGFDIHTKDQWMEKIFVSVIWTLTSAKSSEDHGPTLAEAAAQVLAKCGLSKPSEEATQASLILIWKYIDTMLSQGSPVAAEQWCRFLLKQPIFQGSSNIETKSFRKLILCVLEKYNPTIARQIFDEIPEDCKTCPLTLYLLYRLALLAEDTPLTIAYIRSLCKLKADATYTWSCIADSLQLGKANTAIQSLESVMAVSDDSDFTRLQIAQLLQYVICAVRENHADLEDSLGPVTALLEYALSTARFAQRKPYSSVELRWFSCKSYSIALELYKSASVQAIVKLLRVSTNFMELVQKETEIEQSSDHLEHHLKCAFLQSMILITEARREKKSAKKSQHYKQARETIHQFQTSIQSPGTDLMAVGQPSKWLDKYRIILSFDFEAAIFLHQWDDISRIIETSRSIVSAQLSAVFLDCLLRSGAPSSWLSQFVKQMIRTFHSSSSPFLNDKSPFNEYLARHLRCLFSLSIQAEEYILAESVLDQALVLAGSKTKTVSKPKPGTRDRDSYPKDELQWLATLAFNRAVEFFLVSADDECRRWAGKAIALADLIEQDFGELGRLLRKNLAKLQAGSG